VGNDDKVLSQSEIDALLASSLAKGNAPENKYPAPSPVQQVKVSAAPPPPKVVAQPPKAPPPPPKAAPMAATSVAAAAPIAVKPPAPTAAHAPAPSPAPQPVIHQGPTPEQVTNLCRQVVAEETRDLHKQVIELTIKINKLDGTAQKMAAIEDKIDQMTALIQSSPKAVRALGARVDEIYSLLDALRQEKHASDEGRIHDEFRCVNCQSEKLVAVHVKCTSCGTENWMGWFPDSGKTDHGHY
jgi:outer membrane biosynthesis protein TonB